jgi:hypothetical protein
MPIEAECPLCGHKGAVPEKFDSKQVKCPECCNLFVVSPAKAGVGAKGATSGSASGEQKIKKPAGTMQSIQLPAGSKDGSQKKPIKGPGAGSASGEQKIKKPAGTHQGTMKNPTAGSAQGDKKIVKPSDTAQGTQKNPLKSSGSASGTQKNPAKNATSGSAQGNQKIAPKPDSKQGTQKKPAPAKSNGKKAGDPFASFSYDDGQGRQERRRRKRGKTFGNLLALIALVIFLAIMTAGGIFAYSHFSSGGKPGDLFSAMLNSLGAMLKSSPKAATEAETKPETKPDEPVVEVKATEAKPEPPLSFNVEKEPAIISNGKDLAAQIKVVGVQFGVPQSKDANAPQDKRFMVQLEVENKGKAPLNFQGWGTVEIINETHKPTMTDAAGTAFKRIDIPGGTDGMALAETIMPGGKPVRDMIVFEAPPGGTPFIKVELSAENLDLGFKDRRFTLLMSQGILAKAGLPKPEPKPMPKPEPGDKPDPKPEMKPEMGKEPAEVAVLKDGLKSKLAPSRQEAINGLAALGPAAAGATPEIVLVLQKDSVEVIRAAAAECLGKFKDKAKAAAPALIQAMKKDDFPKVRVEAVTALTRMGPDVAKEAVPAMKEALKEEKDDVVKKTLEEAIKKLDKDGDK